MTSTPRLTVVLSRSGGCTKARNSKSLIDIDPEQRTTLKAAGLLTRDARKKESKKYGLKKARNGTAVLQAVNLEGVDMTLSFGTDGVRGPAPELLNPTFVTCLAIAAREVLSADKWIIGRDTRSREVCFLMQCSPLCNSKVDRLPPTSEWFPLPSLPT